MDPFIVAQKQRVEKELAPVIESRILLELGDETDDTAALIQDQTDAIKAFFDRENEAIYQEHRNGSSGLTVSGYRSALIDTALEQIFAKELNLLDDKIALLAIGGYGRGHLNPASDIDLLFLFPYNSTKVKKSLKDAIQRMLYLLWDMGFKVGHATRSISECLAEAKVEQQSKTAMMDARLIAGDKELFEDFESKFEKECILKDQEAFFELRVNDRKKRHKKYSYTVFLQEPHVKESCGGLRDLHNILWVTRVKRNTHNLEDLVEDKVLTKRALIELEEAREFLHRVRNELHYHTKSGTDILTLQLQGIVATNFNYPEKSILRRCESFMRDYYRHTRNVFNHTNSLMQIFLLEIDESEKRGLKRLFSPRRKRETFDEFIAKDGLIFPKNQHIFKEEPNRIMQMFQHCQIRGLHMSPVMRKLVKSHLDVISSKAFRFSKANRETFRAMLERKGDIAMNLRRMHRVGVLGAYLPEFGAMDCLVQHEFFHRYTADEHTLRCIDELDALVEDTSREKALYRNLLMDFDDPYALYLALILHDSGRAENVREHIDGSAMLASRVCSRLRITGGRRSLITFLVDHHLSFWRFATSRNLEDPAVIEEFASIMKSPQRLKLLLLFTYADSNGTNEEAWSPWKESLMLQLYYSTMQFLREGKDKYSESLNEEKSNLLEEVKKRIKPDHLDEAQKHFDLMPMRYFRYRQANNIINHITSVARFLEKDTDATHDKSVKIKWTARQDRAYTEVLVTCWNMPLLLEKMCCAFASEEISIISADVFTRKDNIVCDIFHVCTLDHQPITDKAVQKRVKDTLNQLMLAEQYEPAKYLKKKKNYLRQDSTEGGIPFPVIVTTNNEISISCTAIQVQALDRIGLLHDLFYNIGKCGLATVHARICTEKGAAMDTIYVTYPDGVKVEDEKMLNQIETTLQEIIG